MPDLSWNHRVWTDYAWPAHGEEWSAEMAAFCGVTPEEWKNSVVREFLIPHLGKDKVALEIGCGHGRWSEIIVPRVHFAFLVDFSGACRSYCQRRFGWSGDAACLKNDGSSLQGLVADENIDFIWSFDTFVHIEEYETRSYAKEFARVMKRQAMGVIHHAGNPTREQAAKGCRSLVTASRFAKILAENGLVVIRQADSWGDGKCNVKLASDVITVFVKP